MISPERFLVEKGILISDDLETKWNLNITRDCHVGTSKRIVEAMKEYAKMHADKAFDAGADHQYDQDFGTGKKPNKSTYMKQTIP